MTAVLSVQQTFCVIIITLLVGQGDGQWKKPSKEMVEQDLKLYKKISENIKQEFEAFYGNYPEGPINDYFLEEIDYVQSKIHKVRSSMKAKENKELYDSLKNIPTKDNSDSTLQKLIPHNSELPTHKFTKESNIINSKWPKFEDILLDIGKRYDWKNDRWIKVKDKHNIYKGKVKLSNISKNIDHQKHNFQYRIVKLNRAKSKRNVVIAVTAVR